jgi:ureidoglycolate hydrolase
MEKRKAKHGAGGKAAARELKNIEAAAFKKYGYLIHWDGHKKKGNGNQFRIVIRDRKSAGWRIAYLIVKDKVIDRLEQHPHSMESFEPVSGRSILHVSNQKKPSRVESFVLDMPIILKKGIWHGVTSVSEETHIKITENSRVKLIRYSLGYTL